MVLSKRDDHEGRTVFVLSSGNVVALVEPGISSTAGLPLLELGRDEDIDVADAFPALNWMIRTDGRLYRISIWGSGLDAAFVTCGGRLNERFIPGVVGVLEAIIRYSQGIEFLNA